jgi:rhodanese-related sulfurtransferase
MQVRQLSTAGLAGWLEDPRRVPPLILDVREPAEFEISHLADARSIPWRSDWRGPLGDVPRTRPIVVYCSIGYRSSAVARELTQAGFTQVSNLEGSIFKWANEGRVLVGPDGNVASVVHPYDARWGRLLAPNLRAQIP